MAKNISNNKKSKPSKILIIILIILLILTVTMLGLGKVYSNKTPQSTDKNQNTKQEENVISNTNNDVVKNQKIGDITFTNIECIFDGSKSLLTYTITNKGSETIKLGEYEIIIKDKDKNILAILAPVIDYELKPLEEYETGNSIDIDLSNATSIELKLSNN